MADVGKTWQSSRQNPLMVSQQGAFRQEASRDSMQDREDNFRRLAFLMSLAQRERERYWDMLRAEAERRRQEPGVFDYIMGGAKVAGPIIGGVAGSIVPGVGTIAGAAAGSAMSGGMNDLYENGLGGMSRSRQRRGL